MITESHMNYGSFSLQLKSGREGEFDDAGKPLFTPQDILDKLRITDGAEDRSWGHIIVTPSEVDPREVDPLPMSVYTGVYRQNRFTDARKEIKGSGLVFWLGDQDRRGPLAGNDGTVQQLTNDTFQDAIAAVLPPAIEPGTVYAEPGNYTFSFLFQTARKRLEAICAAANAEYEITPQGKLNAGSTASLYPTTANPQVFIKRRGSRGDPIRKGMRLADASMSSDVIDRVTRQLLVASVNDVPTLRGQATPAVPSGKRDLFGNLIEITDVAVESDINGANPDSRAAALLAQRNAARTQVDISTLDYDINGDYRLGDTVYVWDPEAGLYDKNNMIEFEGEAYWPIKLRILEIARPLSRNADGSTPGVCYREPFAGLEPLEDITHNLTPYIDWDSPGPTRVTVGAVARSLVPPPAEPLGPIVGPITSPNTMPPPTPDPPDVAGSTLYVSVFSDLGTGGVDFTLPLDLDHLEVHIYTASGAVLGPTTYAGDIVANWSHIEGQASVGRTFEVPTDEQRYVRIVAVNKSGLKSGGSTEVAVVATLIDSVHIKDLAVTDAKIANLSVAKLTAGDISAAIFTLTASGKFRFGRTTAPFHHGYIDANGIHTFRDGTSVYTGGAPMFEVDIANNTMSMIGGTIQTNVVYPKISINDVGEGPDFINFYPAADTAEPGYVWGTEQGTGGNRRSVMSMASGSVDSPAQQARVDLYSADVDNSEPSIGRFSGDRAVLQALIGAGDGGYVEIFGDTIFADSTQDAGFIIDDQIDLVAGGFTMMSVTPVDVAMQSDFTLNDYAMRFRSHTDDNNVMYWNPNIDGPQIRGNQRFLINCDVADAEIYGDGGTVVIQNDGGTAGIPAVASDFQIWSDRRVKTKLSKRAGLLAELRATPVWEYDPTDPDGKPTGGKRTLGVIAQEAPGHLRVPVRRRAGAENENFEGLSLRAMVAHLWGALAEEADEREVVAARLAQIEGRS